MKQAAILGVVYGAISVIMFVVGMSISKEFFFSGKGMVLSLVMGFLVLIIGGRYFLRKIEDVDLSYGVAFKYLLVATIISSAIGMGLSAVIYGNNQELTDSFVEYQKVTAESMQRMVLNMTGASEAQIESEIANLKESLERGENIDLRNPYSMSKLPGNFAMSLVFGIVYCLISAIFVKVKHSD